MVVMTAIHMVVMSLITILRLIAVQDFADVAVMSLFTIVRLIAIQGFY